MAAKDMTTPSTSRPVTLENVPAELKDLRSWVLWKMEDRNGQNTKVPYQTNGCKASVSDAGTWATYAEVVNHLNDKVASVERALDAVSDYAGVGMVVTPDLIFIDLDSCVDPNGSLAPWAAQIVEECDSYSELSPSRSGVHIWVHGVLPPTGRRNGNLEMYDKSRFSTMTGWQLPGTSNTISVCDLASLHDHMMSGEFNFSKPDSKKVPTISAADKIKFLRAGDWKSCGYPSRSEGDEALCRYLSRDLHTAEEIDRAFRQTALMRPKWDRAVGDSTYGAITIAKILATPEKKTVVSVVTESSPSPASKSIMTFDTIPDPRGLSSAPTRALVDGFLPIGQLIIIAGEYGTGKTWFGMMLGNAVSRGERFLGRETVQQKVVYLDRENPLPVIKERMVALFGEHDQDELNYRHWGLWLPDDPPNFGDPRYQQFAVPDSLLIFDSFTRFHSYNENSPTEMAQISAHLRKLQSSGATVLVFHHRDKKMESAYRGTAEIAAGCDVMYSFSRETQANTRTLRQIKSRTALDDNITFTMDFDLPALTPAENPVLAKRREHYDLISATLRDQVDGVRQCDIITRMEREGISRRQTQRLLDAREGSLWTSHGGGRGVPKVYRERRISIE
jgi:hypothetical protein